MSNIAFSTLLASSGHDLKNMINAVLESVDWLNSNIANLSTEQKQEFTKINRLLANANSQLMEILSIYKFENKQYALNFREVDVSSMLELQANFMEPILLNSNLTLVTKVDEDLTWVFDEMLITQAVRNALMNAVKFAKAKIILHAYVADKALYIKISDDGPGFPDAMQGMLTEKNSKVDFSSGSTGLGLYFAAAVANFHSENKINVVITLGKSDMGGSDFLIEIK